MRASLEGSLGVFKEASWEPLGPSWGPRWGISGAPGGSWVLLGLLWPPEGLLGACWWSRGSSRGRGLEIFVRVPPLGGPSWTLLEALLGASWAVLGRYWKPFGPFWSVASTTQTRTVTSFEALRQIVELCLSRPSWGSYYGAVEACWRLLGP